MNRIGIIHPVRCSDGYLNEKQYIKTFLHGYAQQLPTRVKVFFLSHQCEMELEGRYERSHFIFFVGDVLERKFIYFVTMTPNDEIPVLIKKNVFFWISLKKAEGFWDLLLKDSRLIEIVKRAVRSKKRPN